jgi:hypothetical protein
MLIYHQFWILELVRHHIIGRSMPRYKQTGAFQRWAAVSRQLRSPSSRGDDELLLPNPPRSAILARNRWVSGECRLSL